MGRKGIAHIYSSFNNIIITITDLTGAETIARLTVLMYASEERVERKAALQVVVLRLPYVHLYEQVFALVISKM